MTSSLKTAVIGLGSMGYGMAKSIHRAGMETYGHDVDASRVASFQAQGGAKGTLAEVTPSRDVIVVVVLNAEQLENVLFGDDGVVSTMRKGAVVVSSVTVPPSCAVSMEARCLSAGVLFVDAPMSGGSLRALEGDLAVLASGSDEAFAAASPVLEAFARTVFRVGDKAGLGSVMKAVHQILAGVNIVTMAEAMSFGISQGIGADKFLEIMSECGGDSFMLRNRGPHIAEGDYSPHSQVNIWLKDLGIVLDIAKTANFSAPMTSTALQQYVAAAGMGHGHEDDAAVVKVYARNARLDLPGEK